MSTKAIREMLSQYEDMIGTSTSEIGTGALAELEAIEKAAADLTRLAIADKAYDIRERCDMSSQPPGLSSWHHPDVTAWAKASEVLGTIAAQRNAGTAGAVGAKDGATGPQE
jgi:hypothetical protein